MNFSKIKLQQVVEKNFKYNSRKVKSGKDIVKLINKIEKIDKSINEVTIIVSIDNRNHIISYSEIAKGGTDYCNVDLKTLFRTVLLSNASRFILVHNHPSGDTKPSKEDEIFTERIMKASKLIGLELLDHIIIGTNQAESCMYRMN